jgi:leader peptidase (prepilin peptidase)/N-methyltransferase
VPPDFSPPDFAWPAGLVALLLGLVVGSFLNVCIVRWPEGESVVRPASRCPRCGRGVRAYENVPVLSWLALRGRCAGCGLPISPLYPAVELATGLAWLAAVWGYGPTIDGLRVAVFATVLLGIAVTDARRMVIPDGFTLFLLLWALATAVVSPSSGAITLFASPLEAFVGACAGAGAVAIIGWLGELAFKKEAMGFGDVTMMAGVGAALGPERALLTVILGALVGAVASVLVLAPVAYVRHRRQGVAAGVAAGAGGPSGGDVEGEGGGGFELPPVPFGVFLAPAALAALLGGDRMIAWYFAHVLPS